MTAAARTATDRRLRHWSVALLVAYALLELGAPHHWPLPLQAAGIVLAVLVGRRQLDRLRGHRRRRRTDPITGLRNRVTASAELRALVRRTGGVTVLVAAVDGLADIRDALGTQAGDELLASVGRRLDAAGLGCVARTGTNEFAILLPGVDGAAAEATAARLLELAHHAPFGAGDAPIVVEWSIGIATSDDADADLERLLGVADHARHRAVARNAGFEVHQPDREQLGRARLEMLADLRHALAEDQLCVRYQPKARAADGRIVGVEALVRWDHPVHGIVEPGAFLPLLQHSGLSRALTVTVLRQALDQVAAWRHRGHDLTLAVNVTARDLQDPGFPDAVAAVLAQRPGAAAWLQLEVTETGVVADDARTKDTLTALVGLGLKLAIDDFGAGATTLSWLRDLPVNEVKLDKNYVLRMGGSYVDSAIVRAIVDLAHKLRLTVVAEGVEDARTWRELAHMGCDLIQGYHLCPPLAGPDLGAWLDRSVDDADRALQGLVASAANSWG